jgi:hypothetical protein
LDFISCNGNKLDYKKSSEKVPIVKNNNKESEEKLTSLSPRDMKASNRVSAALLQSVSKMRSLPLMSSYSFRYSSSA